MNLFENEKRQKQNLLKQRQEEKALIKKGYQRVQEKLKEIRQNFSVVVTTGRRSGSGKIVLDFYDELVKIRGGSAATEPLSCGTSTEQINTTTTGSTGSLFNDELKTDSDDDLLNIDANSEAPPSIQGGGESVNPVEPKAMTKSDGGLSSGRKREPENTVPKLIDNKRKNMERQLSAAQRDQLLLRESKEDSQFKKDMTEAIRQSNKTFENCMTQMSSSISQVV